MAGGGARPVALSHTHTNARLHTLDDPGDGEGFSDVDAYATGGDVHAIHF